MLNPIRSILYTIGQGNQINQITKLKKIKKDDKFLIVFAGNIGKAQSLVNIVEAAKILEKGDQMLSF